MTDSLRIIESRPGMSTLIVSAASAIAYIALFRFIYEDFLVPVFGYSGFKMVTATEYETLLSNIIAFLPILFFRGQKIPSDLIAVMMYVVVHVPTVITLQYAFKDYSDIIPYQVAFMLAHTLFFLVSWNASGLRGFESHTDAVPMYTYYILGVLVVGVLVAFFGSHLRFVSFADVYSLRGENDKFMRGSSYIGYLMLWSSNFFAPLFIAYGCLQKRVWIVSMGVVCAVVTYMATGLKSAILLPFAAMAIYFVTAHVRTIKYLFPLIVTFVLLSYLLTRHSDNKILFLAATVLFMRTIGVAGWLAAGYITVFNSYPFTYYSHIGIVNFFTGMYPFHNPVLGKAVWSIYQGRGGGHTNANANFLLTDGLAAMGIPGILLIAVVFYLLLLLINKVSAGHAPHFVFAMLTGAIVSFTNISLFTTLVSTGFVFCLLMLRFTRTSETPAAGEAGETPADP